MSARYITDMGGPVSLYRETRNDAGETVSKETVDIGRFGVWDEDGQCFDTGNELDELRRKHGADLPLYTIPNNTGDK